MNYDQYYYYNQHENAPAPPRDDSLMYYLITSLVIAVITLCLLSNGYNYRNNEVEVTKKVVWNFDGMEKELQERVYGQCENLDIITHTLREMIENPKNNSRQTIIVLIGGPGVGKHHVINIIRNHIKCEYLNQSMIEPCQTRYRNFKTRYGMIENRGIRSIYSNYTLFHRSETYNGSLPLFIQFNSLKFSSYSFAINHLLRDIKKFNDIKVCFVIGSVMFTKEAISIENVSEYKERVNYDAKWAEQDIKSNFPDSDVIIVKFNPLKNYHVHWCLEDQQAYTEELGDLLYENNEFVHLGCKTR